jgi:hypothetical protein
MVSIKDRIATINSVITSAKSVGVTNLKEKGVAASVSESVSSLFAKIVNIKSSGGKIAMFTATITPSASARLQVAAGTSNSWLGISQTRTWSTSSPNVTISSGLLFYRSKPVMITNLFCASTVLSYTSATSSNFSCQVTDYHAGLSGSTGTSGGYINCCITSRPKNSSGYVSSVWAQSAGVYAVNTSYRYGITNGTLTTESDRSILSGGFWNSTSQAQFAYWVNRLPDMFLAYCPATTTKYHVLQPSPYYVTGFTIV